MGGGLKDLSNWRHHFRNIVLEIHQVIVIDVPVCDALNEPHSFANSIEVRPFDTNLLPILSLIFCAIYNLVNSLEREVEAACHIANHIDCASAAANDKSCNILMYRCESNYLVSCAIRCGIRATNASHHFLTPVHNISDSLTISRNYHYHLIP